MEPDSLGPVVHRAMAAVDRNQPVSGVFTMSDVVAGATGLAGHGELSLPTPKHHFAAQIAHFAAQTLAVDFQAL